MTTKNRSKLPMIEAVLARDAARLQSGIATGGDVNERDKDGLLCIMPAFKTRLTSNGMARQDRPITTFPHPITPPVDASWGLGGIDSAMFGDGPGDTACGKRVCPTHLNEMAVRVLDAGASGLCPSKKSML